MSRLICNFFLVYNTFTHMKTRTIAVIDLKAFYSYVECLDRKLDPWKTPLVVADKERGTNTIVLSVSPYLKKQGIPSRCRIKELQRNLTIFTRFQEWKDILRKARKLLMFYITL